MDEHKYLLRVPQALWDEVKVAASRNRRSINSEILFRLSLRVADGAEVVVGDSVRSGSGESFAVVEPARQERVGVPPVPDRSFQPDFKRGGKR